MRLLRDLAAPWSQADVSRVTGVPTATVCRLWDDPAWLEAIRGDTLQALAGGLDEVGPAFLAISQQRRRVAAFRGAEAVGLEVDVAVYEHVIGAGFVSERSALTALQAITAMVADERATAVNLCAHFASLREDYALAACFAPPDRDGVLPTGRGLLVDVAPVVVAATRLRTRLMAKTNSFRAMLALAELGHHLARLVELEPIPSGSRSAARHTALARRSEAMGRLLRSDDVELVDRYLLDLGRDEALARVDAWAYPGMTRDLPMDGSLFVPARCPLPRTSAEIVHHVEIYADAYLAYLVRAGIPDVLRRDPTFGGQGRQLTTALHQRLETVGDRRLHSTTSALLAHLPEDQT